MGSIQRITIHHEGWKPVWFVDATTAAQRLDSIRRSHLDRLSAGDIGYHLIIDRAGRLWQGRDTRYQGAHVHEHNANNFGVMVLGNFDLQRPSEAQNTALNRTLVQLMRQYRIPVNRVFTHQEFNITSCPGRALQGHANALRRSGQLA